MLNSLGPRSIFFSFEDQERKGVECSGLHIVFIVFNCGSDLGVLLEANFGTTVGPQENSVGLVTRQRAASRHVSTVTRSIGYDTTGP
jgi:hypothetical protein